MHAVSPSQIATADRCLRRWWWQSVKGFKSPPTAATEFGGAVHTAIEGRILNGEWPVGLDPEVSKRAQAAYVALVEHLNGVQDSRAEVELAWELPSGVLPSRGRIDLVLPVRNKVVDWKTTSSLSYAKTEEELVHDPQVVLYVRAMVDAGLITLPCEFLHVYTVTKGRANTRVVSTRVTADSLTLGQYKLDGTMRRMVKVLTTPNCTREDVPANPLACQDFGGCPHYERCFGAAEVEQQPEQEQKMNLSEKLAARKAAQSAAPVEVATKQSAPAACIPTDTQRGGQTLLIGALPYGSREEWIMAEEWLRTFADQAAEMLKVQHWAYAEYGKGKTTIVALVDAAARAGNIPANLILDRRNTLSDAVAEVLLPHYRNVFVKMG